MTGAGLVRCYQRGRDAALAGRSPMALPPYLSGANRDAWRQGYADGCADIAAPRRHAQQGRAAA